MANVSCDLQECLSRNSLCVYLMTLPLMRCGPTEQGKIRQSRNSWKECFHQLVEVQTNNSSKGKKKEKEKIAEEREIKGK